MVPKGGDKAGRQAALPLLQVSAGNAHLVVQQIHVKQQIVATLYGQSAKCVFFVAVTRLGST